MITSSMAVKAFHSLGFAHGDLHAQNLMVKSESIVQLIDLDNIRKTRRRQQKDIARFTESVKNGTQNTTVLLNKIHTQL